MIDKFKEIPDTEQGLKDYIRFATNEIKHMHTREKKLKANMDECNRRLGEITCPSKQ